jgi:hypothetical protein
MKFIHLILIYLATSFKVKSFFVKLVQDATYLKDDSLSKIEYFQ